MLACQIETDGLIATVQLTEPRFAFSKVMNLETALAQVSTQAIRGIIFDASALSKMSQSGLGALVEVFSRLGRERWFYPFPVALALCGLPQKTCKQVTSQGLDRVIPVFADRASALADPNFMVLRLGGVRSVLLCAGQGARLAPLTTQTPVGLLDYLGRPIAAHIMRHAGRFGLSDFVLNPGHLATQMERFAHRQTYGSVFCVNEAGWSTTAASDLATLARLQSAHGMFAADTFVFQANVLSDLDLAAMMTFHRSTQADATVAVSNSFAPSAVCGTASQKERFASAILVSPHAMEALAKQAKRRSVQDILPALQTARLNVQTYVSEHDAASIQCGADYFASVARSLETGAYGICPTGEQISNKVWLGQDAKIDRPVEIDGACFVGAQSHIRRGSVLRGTNIIGPRTVVNRNAVLSNSMLMPTSHVAEQAFVDHMIAGPDWAVNHRFADGSLQNRAPLEDVRPLHRVGSGQQNPKKQVAKLA